MERLKKDTHPLLNDVAISALNKCKIFTARDFITTDSQKLAKISLMLFKEILEIKKHLIRKFAATSTSGYDSYQDLLINSALIPSGIKSIDEFLQGGLLTSNIYEFCGRAATGKTLLAYIFMRNLVMEMKQNCFILDAKNDFSAEKFSILCEKYSNVMIIFFNKIISQQLYFQEEVINGLSRIFIKPIENIYDLLNSLHEISGDLEKNRFIRLIVIDSLAAVISNKVDHSLNNLCLTHLANIMHFIATKYHVVILILNLMTTWVKGDFVSQIETKETISCGKYWYTVPNTRIKLKKNQNFMELVVGKSNTLSMKSVSISLDNIINLNKQ